MRKLDWRGPFVDDEPAHELRGENEMRFTSSFIGAHHYVRSHKNQE